MTTNTIPLGHQKCPHCKTIKPDVQFRNRRGRTVQTCSDCRGHDGQSWCTACGCYRPYEELRYHKTCEKCRAKRRVRRKAAGTYYEPTPTFIATAPAWFALTFYGTSPFNPQVLGCDAAFAVELSIAEGRGAR